MDEMGGSELIYVEREPTLPGVQRIMLAEGEEGGVALNTNNLGLREGLIGYRSHQGTIAGRDSGSKRTGDEKWIRAERVHKSAEERKGG